MSGNSLSNFSISSSPVTLISVVRDGGVLKSSKEKLSVALMGGAAPEGGTEMSPEPSSEISGKAEAARSKSMSPPAVANEPPVGVPNSSPRMSLSRCRKSVIVGSVVEDGVVGVVVAAR